MAGDSGSLTFRLFGRDVSASSALEGVGDAAESAGDRIKTGLAAGAAAGAAALGLALADAMDQQQATARLSAALGATGPEAAALGEMAGRLYSSGLGEGFGDVTTAMSDVSRQLGDLAEGATGGLEGATEKAMRMSEAFEEESGRIAQAAAQMVRNGLAGNVDDAMDLIASGMQNGVDKSQDLIDTFNEYGTQFRKMGLDGADAMGLMAQGIAAGARDADTVADGIKEFTIRAIDGSKATIDGFTSLGLSAKQMQADLAAGGDRSAAAMDTVLDTLRAVEDPAERSRIAVELFGTKAEDLGDSLYALDLSTAASGLGDVAGAAQQVSDTLEATPAEQLEATLRGIRQQATELAAGLLGFAAANAAWLLPLAGTLGTVVAGIYGVALAVSVVRTAITSAAAVTRAWTLAQAALNVVMSMNPLGLVVLAIAAVVAAMVVAYAKVGWFRGAVQSAMAAVAATFGRVRAAAGAALGWVRANWPLLLGILTLPIGGAVLIIIRYWDRIVAGARAMVTRIRGALSGLPGQLRTIGTQMIDGLVSAIRGGASRAAQAMRDVATDAINAAKAKLGIASPSRVFATIGRQVIEGLTGSLTGGAAAARRALVEPLKAAVEQARQLAADAAQLRSSVADRVSGGELASEGGLTGMVDDLRRRVSDAQALGTGLAQLRRMGLGASTLRQLAEAGPASLTQVQALAGGGRGGVAEVNWLSAQLAAAGQRAGRVAADGVYGARIAAADRRVSALRTLDSALASGVHIHLSGSVVGSPEVLARAVDDALRRARRRGLTTGRV